MAEAERRCGFAALIGAPNAGKSTLTNALVGQKVSIVSRKVQTTRTPVRGIAIAGDAARPAAAEDPGAQQDRPDRSPPPARARGRARCSPALRGDLHGLGADR